MNTVRLVLVFLVCIFAAPIVPGSVFAQENGLDALHHYDGVWDCEFTIQAQTGQDDVKKYSGVVESKWVVGDQFLEQSGQYVFNESSPPLIIRTMMSFDKKKNRYRYVYFMSSGEIHASDGQWDEQTKTMTSQMNDAEKGNTTTIVADFSEADTEHWTIETQNSDGEQISKMAGTNTRRKDK